MGGTPFKARLARWRGDKIERLTIGTEADARAAEADVKAGHFTVDAVETKPLTRNPPPPLTTSTLQQEAARKLGFSASHTMRRSEEHTSELQSLMRISYAVLCLKKKNKNTQHL